MWEAVDSGGGRRATIVINPDASAGNTTIQEPPVLEAWLNKSLVGGQLAWVNSGEGDGAAGVAQALQLRAEGRPTGAWLLLGALVLALAELGLARWASHGGS